MFKINIEDNVSLETLMEGMGLYISLSLFVRTMFFFPFRLPDYEPSLPTNLSLRTVFTGNNDLRLSLCD